MDLVQELRHACTMKRSSRTTVNVDEAKTHLSELLERVEAGEEVIIARAGRPVARLIPLARVGKRTLGLDAAAGSIAPDFDAPLPAEVLADFGR
jgi:prevent-host-death family protein